MHEQLRPHSTPGPHPVAARLHPAGSEHAHSFQRPDYTASPDRSPASCGVNWGNAAADRDRGWGIPAGLAPGGLRYGGYQGMDCPGRVVAYRIPGRPGRHQGLVAGDLVDKRARAQGKALQSQPRAPGPGRRTGVCSRPGCCRSGSSCLWNLRGCACCLCFPMCLRICPLQMQIDPYL